MSHKIIKVLIHVHQLHQLQPSTFPGIKIALDIFFTYGIYLFLTCTVKHMNKSLLRNLHSVSRGSQENPINAVITTLIYWWGHNLYQQ